MKTPSFFAACLALTSLFAPVPHLVAQGTAFTYQGRLNDGANPASGGYDLTFSVWTAASGPAQVGSTLISPNTAVSNGLFTVVVDFGNQFPGANRWLEIGVRTNGSAGAHTTLTPRQPVTATPYAVTAGSLSGPLPAANLTGTVQDARLSPNVALLAGSPIFNSDLTIASPFDLNFGSTTRQMLNLWNTNYGVGVQNNTLYQRSDGGFAWFRRGNHNDNPNNPGTGGTNLMTLDGSGNLFANASVTVDVAGANNGSYYPGLVFGYGSGEAISSQRGTNGSNRYGLDFYTGFSPRLSIANNGNVGIGTVSPDRPLAVQANGGSELLSLKDNTGLTRWHLNLQNGGLNFVQSLVADGRLFFGTNGNTGIGTLAPAATLDVAGSIRTRNGGIVFPDGSVQTRAAEGSTSPNTASGYPIGATVTVTLNGSPCTLDGPLTSAGVALVSLPTVQTPTTHIRAHLPSLKLAKVRVKRVRPAGASDWATAFHNTAIGTNSSPSNPTNWNTLVVSVTQPGGATRSVFFGQLLFYGYSLNGNGGQLIEVADLVSYSAALSIVRTGSLPATTPSADVPGLSVLTNGVAFPGAVLASLPLSTVVKTGRDFPLVVTSLQDYPESTKTLTLRANLSSGADLLGWQQESYASIYSTRSIAVRQNGVTLVAADEAVGVTYRLRLADDGLPIEELDVEFIHLTAP